MLVNLIIPVTMDATTRILCRSFAPLDSVINNAVCYG